jgi:DNA mismatch repair ATPase MutS
MQQEEILTKYLLEKENFTQKLAQATKQLEQHSYYRIGLFLVEILFFVLFLNSAPNILRDLLVICLLIPIGVFIYIAKKQNVLDDEIAHLKQLIWVYQNEINIINQLDNGYKNGANYESEAHNYSSDLDIFGPSSLFSLLNRCSTNVGEDLLANHLSTTNSINEIIDRQEAVKEVKDKIDTTFDFRANLLGLDNAKLAKIKVQLNNQLVKQLEFARSKFLIAYIKIVPYVSIALIVASIFVDARFWQILSAFFIANLAITGAFYAKVNLVFYCFSGGANLLNNYALSIKWTENHDWRSKYILNFFRNKTEVSDELKSLSKIIKDFDARLNIVLGSILNGLFMWDINCCIKLDKWLKASSADVVEALDRIGKFEELISIATLNYNEASWVYPTVKDKFALEVQNLGHPLIKPTKRVSNNFKFEDVATADIITGSNMAGKSTFLRTVGINMVLAYLGSAVCADKMTVSVFNILTYMRIKDSLNESTSTFKAELNRLKMILDTVARDENSFVLIDEMLRGTNSRDKFLGSKVFIEKLISTKTPLLFATHDLQLSELENEYQTEVRNYHFDIQITEGEMEFDYKLKIGPCKTFNAAILLKQIGLNLN